MRVLYVNHTATISGGERSLIGLLAALPAGVEATLAAPAGELTEAVSALGVPVIEIAGTAGSLRLHPLHTPRALIEMGAAALQVRRAARRTRAQVVHANSIRAGIVLGLAPRLRGRRFVHVRDCLPSGPLTSATARLIARTATTIVANSHYTADCFARAAPRARPEVVYNAVDARFDVTLIDRAGARAALGVHGKRPLLLGVVAQLSPWKGQDTAIEALALLRARGIDARLLLIGAAKFVARATRFDNEAYVQRLHALAAQGGLAEHVSFMGEREDVPALIRALDVLLAPSWEEPFGRSIVEALALGVPVVATNVGGPPEIVEDGREGYLLAPGEPAAWADALQRLAESPELAQEMGRAGQRRVAQAFTTSRHIAAMLDLYERAL